MHTRCIWAETKFEPLSLLPPSLPLKSIAINYFNYLIWGEAVINWHFAVLFPCPISPSLSLSRNEHHKSQWHRISHNDMIVLLWKIGKSFFLGDTFSRDTICEKKALYQDILAPDVFHVFFRLLLLSVERCCVYARQHRQKCKKFWRYQCVGILALYGSICGCLM